MLFFDPTLPRSQPGIAKATLLKKRINELLTGHRKHMSDYGKFCGFCYRTEPISQAQVLAVHGGMW